MQYDVIQSSSRYVIHCVVIHTVPRSYIVSPLTIDIYEFLSRAARWISMIPKRDDAFMVPYKFFCFGQIRPLVDPGQSKICHSGPSFNKLFLQTKKYCMLVFFKYQICIYTHQNSFAPTTLISLYSKLILSPNWTLLPILTLLPYFGRFP